MNSLPHPASPEAPKYWMHETGGELKPAMKRYLLGEQLSDRDVLLIKLYLKQWIDSPAWDANPAMDDDSRIDLASLRVAAASLRDRTGIDEWIKHADEIGIDPL
jgi:hypothetical protein